MGKFLRKFLLSGKKFSTCNKAIFKLVFPRKVFFDYFSIGTRLLRGKFIIVIDFLEIFIENFDALNKKLLTCEKHKM